MACGTLCPSARPALCDDAVQSGGNRTLPRAPSTECLSTAPGGGGGGGRCDKAVGLPSGTSGCTALRRGGACRGEVRSVPLGTCSGAAVTYGGPVPRRAHPLPPPRPMPRPCAGAVHWALKSRGCGPHLHKGQGTSRSRWRMLLSLVEPFGRRERAAPPPPSHWGHKGTRADQTLKVGSPRDTRHMTHARSDRTPIPPPCPDRT